MAPRGIRHRLDDGGEGEPPALLVLPADLLVVATSTLFGIARAITAQLDVLDDLARMHANRQHERAEFVSDVRSTIEGIQ